MYFQLRPILSEIKALYQTPITPNRFKEYIGKLQGNSKGDLQLPISGFNPMAKDHILQKISELEKLAAEQIASDVIKEVNQQYGLDEKNKIDVVINLADDLKGAWTNHHTTDYESKFKFNALVNRNFCTPYFWTSESYDEQLIKKRTLEYLRRTIYWLNNPKPKTLADHVNQEIFVFENNIYKSDKNSDLDFIKFFYSSNKNSAEHDVIFNFFYGDLASKSLGYKTHGIKEITGFDYVKLLAGPTTSKA